MNFSLVWFPDRGFESVAVKELSQMNLNTKGHYSFALVFVF